MRALDAAQVTHQLRGSFGYISAFAKCFGISQSVVGFVRGTKARKFVCMSVPVEVTAVNYTTAYAGSVSVHIFGCGVNNDVGTPFERATVDGGRESIIHNQRYSVIVSDTGEFLNIQHFERRIGNSFTEQCFCIWLEGCGNFFFAGVRIDESNVYA